MKGIIMKKNIINKLDCFADTRNDDICHAELISASQTTPLIRHFVSPSPTIGEKEIICAKHDKNLSTCRLNVLETDNTPHPNPVLDLLHAHRVSPKLLRNKRLNLFAIRTCFTPSVRKSALPQGAREQKCAFTLAEVLITLGIIGVVAALTLPTLIGNYQKQALATQTKKFYSMMSQAVKQYMADEGVDDLRNTPLASDNYEDTASPEAIESIRNFVTKYLKVVEECDHEANNCFAEKYKSWDGEESSFTTYMLDYVLSDGSVIKIGYMYTPISLYVDVNGKKGPNRVGYDLWSMDIFYDGVIDESGVGPECRGRIENDYEYAACTLENTAQMRREDRYEGVCAGGYGGCFGHFLNNNFTFDY